MASQKTGEEDVNFFLVNSVPGNRPGAGIHNEFALEYLDRLRDMYLLWYQKNKWLIKLFKIYDSNSYF